jgi:hypothetical protein
MIIVYNITFSKLYCFPVDICSLFFFFVVYRLHRVKLDTGNSIYRDVRIDVKTYLINYTGFEYRKQISHTLMVHAYNQYQRHIIQAIRNTVSCASYCLLTKMTDKDEGEFSLSFTKYTFTNAFH